ncbi:MAG TPA: GH116 family glycosyl hydrolase, partial [Armatimonadota bacterium]|nr:GH116 family glycosyl hydrolase [Armatimonadota bacterium]
LKPENVRQALRSLMRYNFKANLFDHWNTMRTFALNDEAALLICSYPHGERPEKPFPYFTEVMTGFEYQAAAHMIYEGMVDEGLQVISAIRARYDGRKRSPWDEAECGHHYARAMASWAAVLALTGFHYDGVTRSIAFAPKTEADDFQTFWSIGSAWGTYRQQRTGAGTRAEITVLQGQLVLQSVCIGKEAIHFESERVVTTGQSLSVGS